MAQSVGLEVFRVMKGRTVWVFISVFLLSAPLLGIVVLWLQAPAEQQVEGWRFVPWMSSAEFRAQRDLLKPCQEDAQCTPPLVCFHDPREPQGHCSASACYSDAWCSPQGVCRAIPMLGQHRALRMCVLEGLRKEGEPCIRLPDRQTRTWACEGGLQCGISGWCGRRCIPGQAGTCPEGFFCARGDPDGPVCQPSCEGRSCPEGQECLRREGGVAVCVQPTRFDCSASYPCSKGRVCVWDVPPSAVGEIKSLCLVPCGTQGSAACPEDDVCHEGFCRPRCDPIRPKSCVIGFCVSTDAVGHGVCLPSPEPWSASPGTRPLGFIGEGHEPER